MATYSLITTSWETNCKELIGLSPENDVDGPLMGPSTAFRGVFDVDGLIIGPSIALEGGLKALFGGKMEPFVPERSSELSVELTSGPLGCASESVRAEALEQQRQSESVRISARPFC